MECKFFLSQKGKEKLTMDGYTFDFEKFSACNSKKFWACDRRKSDKCKSRIHTTNEGILLKELNGHTHDSNAAQVEATIIVSKIKERAKNTMESTSQVINECVSKQGLLESVKVALPSEGAVKKVVRRVRQEVNAAPPVPTKVEDLIIPENFKQFKCANGEIDDFLLADNGPVSNRILIFGRKKNLKVSLNLKY